MTKTFGEPQQFAVPLIAQGQAPREYTAANAALFDSMIESMHAHHEGRVCGIAGRVHITMTKALTGDTVGGVARIDGKVVAQIELNGPTQATFALTVAGLVYKGSLALEQNGAA